MKVNLPWGLLTVLWVCPSLLPTHLHLCPRIRPPLPGLSSALPACFPEADLSSSCFVGHNLIVLFSPECG